MACAREPSGWVRPVLCIYIYIYIFTYIYVYLCVCVFTYIMSGRLWQCVLASTQIPPSNPQFFVVWRGTCENMFEISRCTSLSSRCCSEHLVIYIYTHERRCCPCCELSAGTCSVLPAAFPSQQLFRSGPHDGTSAHKDMFL